MPNLVTISVTVPDTKIGAIFAAAALANGFEPGSDIVISGTPSPAPFVPTGATTPVAPASVQSAPTSETGNPATGAAEVDALGTPWDPALHTASKGKTKDGQWRMKPGVRREEGAPSAADPASSASNTLGASTSAPTANDDDEFANWGGAQTSNPPEGTVTRNWTDADLSDLCGQAAQKAGNPDGVKKIIADYVAEGEVCHSRNVPAADRQDFVDAIEAEFSIKFVG